VISYTPYDALEIEAVRLEDGVINTIHFNITDAEGTLVPMDPTSSWFIQLCILELPTI
jgi:hypothetical protein